MSDISPMGNLGRSTVRPLRNTARAREDQGETVQRFSVEELKNGGSLNLGGAVGQSQEAGSDPASLRQRSWNRAPKASDSQVRNSQLSLEERVDKLKKIRQSAVQYESVFVDHLVKQMRQSPLTKTPGGDTFSDIAEQPFRDFLSQAGGVGLADTIVGQVARQEGLEQTLHEYPDIMGPNWRPAIPKNLMHKSGGGLEMAPRNNKTHTDQSSAAPEPNPAVEPRAEAPRPDGPPAAGSAGQVNEEEIAWLYRDASESLA